MKVSNLLFLSLFMLSVGCSGRKAKSAIVTVAQERPIIDGSIDDCWKGLPEYPIDGTLGGDINWDGEDDLSATFRVLMHDNDLFFLVKVTDDIEGFLEESMMIQHWENDNVEFFFTNATKLSVGEMSETDTIYFVNYSAPYDRLQKLGNIPEYKSKNISFGRQNIEGGYLLEVCFEKELGVFDFEKSTIPFNIGLADNDNEIVEKGFMKGSESGISWGYNSGSTSWKESINYGDLVIDR
ncbi:MAG: sugar-binding protein [Cytophagales bacterium]|nr:sugar-binding protein [Cytophagales bacterium]